MTTDTIYGLVLAGGESRRMGRDKALLVRDGQSQLAHIAALLKGITERVFVSSRQDQQDDPERSRFENIVDRYEGIGPIAGILSAMDAHPNADWLVVACDLPNIDEVTLSFLIANAKQEQPFTAFKSNHDGLPEPLCALYRCGSDAIIRRFVEDGIVCPRKILMRSDALLLEQPNPVALDNINTPDDLAGSVLEAAS
ncbi:MAG: NTP transferase domain-containing protein [Gammaproteobacteria bacterium]|nr:NTP transferase domain-containing protein [Gammaproteobacteria bacterium]MDH3415285.1 NTP transferase domain-containing protein [Gammaproteobacteria bacterium]